MIKIGITGGVGSGKSEVLKYLAREKDMTVYQADLLAHEVQEPGQTCYKKICAYFGGDICAEDGRIDRNKLGEVVFAEPEKLEMLNAFVHPAVEERVLELIEWEEARGTTYFVLEAALLHKKFYRDILDEIWYIHVREDVRRGRLSLARGYSEKKTTSIIDAQPSEALFRKISDRVIENSEGFEQTIEQIELAIKELELGDR